ncbi:MAG TPA: transglycosylase domain-containing protein [Kofleriaceae bacterium]|nr:transglycosylase domain-containing protein [Kofleriaceae bacterium]
MKLPTLSRRWWITSASLSGRAAAGAAVVGLAIAIAIGLLVVYPRVGARAIREKIAAKAAELGREARIGAIDVSLGRAVVEDVEIFGPNDGMTPLVHIDRLEVEFGTLASLVGRVELGDAVLDGVLVSLRRGADGRDNVSDIVTKLRSRVKAGGSTTQQARSLPRSVRVLHVKVVADDAITGATAIIGDGNARWKPGELVALARNVTATTIAAPRASASTIEVKKLSGSPPSVAITGGELAIWPRLALSGISGRVIADPDRAHHYVVDLAGGYGGVPGNLWTAKGGLDTAALTASIDLEAAKFQLARLAPILEQSPVVDYQSTSVDTKLHLELDRDGGKFAGEFHLTGLNVGHPMIADKEVHDLDLTANVAGTFSRGQRRFELSRGDFEARGVPFSVTGAVGRPHELVQRTLAFFFVGGGASSTTPDLLDEAPELVVRHGPAGIQYFNLRLVIPPIDCQRVLDAIPPEMAPYMMGYQLRGVFDTDVTLDVDYTNLDATRLGGHVGIRRCKVVGQPEDSPRRLAHEFEHYVEVEKGQWMSFVVGPSNEDFVPIEEISPFLIKSIMTTEDAGFYNHRGFITSEFRTALVNDLKAGKFKYGASSITMQMVKNVLLYREKTLARKLQELFLTWHVENTLGKDRILEIYFNVIEYGPALYGIGPAARHFFGKHPKDLNPVEAAFFSSILPSPKERYKQYCANTLTKWTDAKIKRILALMLKRERLTPAENDAAVATPLLFIKDGSETEDDCLRRVKKAIKNARSTNPLKR